MKPITDHDLKQISQLARQYGAAEVSLFGSFARGEARAESDIDLLVTLAPGRGLLDLIAIKQSIEDAMHLDVDVLTRSSLSPYIRQQVLAEAIAI